MAQSLGAAEFVVEWYFFPHTKVLSQTTLAGTSDALGHPNFLRTLPDNNGPNFS